MSTATTHPTERRFISNKSKIQHRMEEGENAGPGTITHHSPPWDTLSTVLWYEYGRGRDGEPKPVREQFRRGAFAGVLGSDSVVCLRDHNNSLLLGRNTAGTLKLTEDDVGLLYECHLPDNQEGRSTAISIARGDLDGSSFAFQVDDDDWEENENEIIRTVIKVSRLMDVGPVTYPAYTAGEPVGLRSIKTPAFDGETCCRSAVESFRAWAGDDEGAKRLLEAQKAQMLAEMAL